MTQTLSMVDGHGGTVVVVVGMAMWAYKKSTAHNVSEQNYISK